MKIRHPILISLLGFLIAWFIRLWICTVRYWHWAIGPNFAPHLPDLPERVIYSFWHEHLLIPAYQYSRPDIHVLISRHADGQLIAEAVKHLGMKVVYGSSTRGGVEALLKLVGLRRHSHIGITPDGPRGPRRHAQIGIVYIAAKTGMPIIPAGFGYSSVWRTKSWDRMVLPMPFSRVVVVSLPPIRVPNVEDKDVLERYRQQVEDALNEATRLAQEATDTNKIAQGNGQIDVRRAARTDRRGPLTWA